MQPSVSVSVLENSCGFGHVTNLLQDGADSTFAADDELSVKFHANLNNTRYSYVLGLFRVTGTIAVNTARVINTAPTVTLSGITGSIQGRQTVTVTFSEAVTGLTEADFTLTNASIASGSLAASGGNAYTFDIIPTSPGAVHVTLPATKVQSTVELNNTASNTLSATAIDSVPIAAVFSIASAAATSTPHTAFSPMPAPQPWAMS